MPNLGRFGKRGTGILLLLAILTLTPALTLTLPLRAADLVPVPDLGLRVERGFNVTLFADNDLAPDTWCMTLDALGRVVVANGVSIRTLADDDDDGEADRVVEFARVERGVMGMCFYGTSLYVAADGWFQRYDDANGDGVADGPPERLSPLGFGEHGGHAMRKGPDGWWYLVGGNDAAFTEEKHATIATSPIRKPEGGAILRFTPDGSESEIIAHGFRNPYDFDFNLLGDIFTYDSDVEADAFLPWYVPTRVYHVGYGQHHGWRLPGYKRSWPRPDYYADTVPILARAGRGSPTGVTCYRHFQFPQDYFGALFFADWTFGRIYVMDLDPNGASYSLTEPDVFMEPMGTHGFAPTDIDVAPDGSMYIAIGGRKTRGAIYHVEWTGQRSPLAGLPIFPSADLNNVLIAAQPLEAWSRAVWMPAAARLGGQPLAQVATDNTAPPEYRARAIEVLTEMFGGVPAPRARAVALASEPLVRARMAWSLGRLPGENAADLLVGLALDSDATVRRTALEAIADRVNLFDTEDLAQVLPQAMAHPDKYVRLAAARVGSVMAPEAWTQITTLVPRNTIAVTAASIAQTWRTPDQLTHPEIVPALTNLLAQNREPYTRLEAMRMLILALGDWRLNNPSVEVNTAYELASPPGPPFNVGALKYLARTGLAPGSPLLNMESARLLAMLEDDERRTPSVIMNFVTVQSPATSDFHYLACLSRLRATAPELAPRIAAAILALNSKLGNQETRVKQNWNTRLVEVVQQLARRDPSVGDALLRHTQFTTPAHVFLAHALEGERKNTAARQFLAAIKGAPSFPWSSELVSLLLLLPPEETTPVFRQHWNSIVARDEILPRLAAQPIPADRPKFLAGLSSPQPTVVQASLGALLKLPPDQSGTNLVAPLKLLSRSATDPVVQPMRAQVLTLVTNSLKQGFKIEEPANADAVSLRKAHQPVFDFVAVRYPGLLRAMNAEDNDDPLRWNNTWRSTKWDAGNAARGEQIFTERACASCHQTAGQIGPDLAGVAQRFSAEDLMNAIVFPSRDIAPPYRTTTFRLRNGEAYTGIVAFESADGWILQTGAGTSVRISSADVLSRTPSNVSIMPSGLLNGLSSRELADLYAYMRTLQAR